MKLWTWVGTVAMTVGVALGIWAETPDFAHAAVTDMNPGVMLSVSWLEVEGDAPYVFYAAKPGAYYFWGRADGAEKGEQSTVNVRYAGFHRFKKPGKKYVMELSSCPVALWFGDGPVKYRALPPPPKCKNTELFGKLWYHEPNGEVRVDEVAAEDAPKVCKMGCAFLNPTRFWHVAPLGLAAPVPPPAPKKAASAPKPDPQPTADDIAKMEAVIADTSFARPKAPRKVVLFNNCYGYRHSGATGFGPSAFKLAAEKTGAFAVTVETDLQRLADAEFLKGFDAIVLNSTTSIEEKKVPGVTKALTGAVAGGRGLVLLHAAVDAFYESPEIQKMNGSLFFGHPWSSPGTWSFVNEQPENPINAPFRKLPVIMKFSDEIYQFSTPPYSRANCDVLVSMDMSDTLTQAAADRWGAGWYGVNKRRFDGDYAVSYTKRYYEGRVFYTSFGHDHRAFLDARFAHMLLGLQWSLGDLEVPKRDDSALVDRLWMWGHEPECWNRFVEPFARLGMDPSNHCGQAAGCKLMGIKRDCMIRWLSLPELPLTDEKVKELSTLDELAWSITDSDKTRSFLEKVDIAISMKKRLPNLTTVFLDDYFQSHMRPLDELKTARERVHAAGLRMAAVMYADVEGYRESDLPSAKLCDVIALWFWKPDSFDTMEQKVLKAKEFLGADMPLMLGLYMWNFGDGFGPVTGAKMKAQLAVAGKLLRDGTVGGLIFHPTISADMDVPAVNISKKWIRDLAENGPKPVRVALTFDDGTKDHIALAAPMLEERGWRGTFNLITDKIGTRGHLTWDDVKELIRRGHEVTTHTKTHPNLVAVLKEQGPDAVHREWSESRDAIVRNAGFAPRYACMPFGQENETIRAICREEGLEPFGRYRRNFGTGDEDKVGPWLETCYAGGVVRVDALCHGVAAGEGGGWRPFADRAAFAKYLDQIAALEKAGKVIVTDYAGMMSGCALKAKAWPRHGVLTLSFDDHHIRRWDAALPLFAKYGAKTTFCISGGIDGEAVAFARKALAEGHEIALHGFCHRNADTALPQMGEADYWAKEIETQLASCRRAGIPVTSFAYPNSVRSDETDRFFLARGFTKARGSGGRYKSPNPHDPKGAKLDQWKPVATFDPAFDSAADVLKNPQVKVVVMGRYYHTDINDVQKAMERAGTRAEQLSVVSHDIADEPSGIGMRTEWLERMLSVADAAGVVVRGLK